MYTETAPAPAEAPKKAPANDPSNKLFDLSALDTLDPQKRSAPGRDPAWSPQQVEAFYNARKRGISWAQINSVLPKPLSRAGTLASSVHGAARRHGIEPFKVAGSKEDNEQAQS